MSATTATTAAPGADLADQYLGDTEEIYRRPVADGATLVVRRSVATYADTFGYQWTAPTGDGSCLGDHAVFIGVPGQLRVWGSAWTAERWYDGRPDFEVLAALNVTDTDPQWYAFVKVGAAEGTLRIVDGGETDEAPIQNGFAVVLLGDSLRSASDVAGSIVGESGELTPVTITTTPTFVPPQECGPGPAPQQPMPPTGAQPTDPRAGEIVRGLLVALGDPSVPWSEKTSMLDDDSGVQAAADAAGRGQFAAQTQSARYSVDELVFTSPAEAWMRYTITTDVGTYPQRIGRGVLLDGQWRITRSTICADLAFAQSPCQPSPEPLVLPVDLAWERTYQEWMARATLYNSGDGCPPLSMC